MKGTRLRDRQGQKLDLSKCTLFYRFDFSILQNYTIKPDYTINMKLNLKSNS